MDAGQSIVLVIGIVDKHRIRFFIFQAECAVICDRNIWWILISLVVFYCQIPILVFIKIGDRYNIGIAIRIFICRFPDGFHRIPHRHFIWKKDKTETVCFHIILHTFI